MPKQKGAPDLPSTLQRSDEHAQEIYSKAHDSAVETYGEGERAHRTAYAALKHSYRKQGDRWVPKDRKGPSDPQAARGPTTSPRSTDRPAKTAGGQQTMGLENESKDSLYEMAQEMDIAGRSSMSKDELIREIKKRQR